jgi:hypothetical protein
MSVVWQAKVCRRFLWGGDSSNTPLEWTGLHQFFAAPPQVLCLPLKGSVSPTEGARVAFLMVWSRPNRLRCHGRYLHG